MKKTVFRVLALALLAALCLVLLSGCGGKLKGTYTSSGDLLGLVGGSVSFTFKGGDVTLLLETSLLGYDSSDTYSGEYELDKKAGTILLTFREPEAKAFSGAFPFQQGDGYIKIDGTTYTAEK